MIGFLALKLQILICISSFDIPRPVLYYAQRHTKNSFSSDNQNVTRPESMLPAVRFHAWSKKLTLVWALT